MIEVVVSPIVDGRPLRGQAIPVVQITREKGCDARALIVAEVVPAHLSMVVRKPVRISLRFRQKQDTDILVDITGKQHDVCRLEVFHTILEVVDPAHTTVRVGFDGGYGRLRHDLETPGFLRLGNGGDRRGTLGADVAATTVAVAVVRATRSVLIGSGIDGGRPWERMPLELPRRRRHHF